MDSALYFVAALALFWTLAYQPWIERRHTGWRKVSDIARDNCHSVDQRCRGDQPVTNGTWIGHVKSCAALCHCGIDDQDATREGRQDVAIQPRPEDRPLRWIAAFSQQYTNLQFLDSDHG